MVTVFISYSHDDEAHINWVSELGKHLESRGVKVIRDETDLKYGGNVDRFIRESIEKADFILVICTPFFRRKVEQSMGGGAFIENEYIKQITKEMQEAGRHKEAEDKFIPVLRAGSAEQAIPLYLRIKLWVDLTHQNLRYDEELEKLCRQLLGKDTGPLDTYELFVDYDEDDDIEDLPPIPALANYTQVIDSGRDSEGRWFVKRYDPLNKKEITIFFKPPPENLLTRILGRFLP